MLKRWVEISTVIGCASNCVYCPQSVLTNEYCKSNVSCETLMSLETFRQALRNIPKDIQIDFSGMSEPFQNPLTIDMIIETHNQGYEISLHTTLRGLALDKFNQIKNIPFKEFCIHLPDKDMHMHYAPDEEFFKVLEAFVESDIPNKKYVVFGILNPLILDFVNVADISVLKVNTRASNLEESDLSCGLNKLEFNKSKLKNKQVMCTKIFDNELINGIVPEGTVMLPNGDMVLCCMDYGLKHKLGNILNSSYEDVVLKSPVMNKIIEEMLDKNNNSVLCKNCEYAMEYSKWKLFVFKYFGEYPSKSLRRYIFNKRTIHKETKYKVYSFFNFLGTNIFEFKIKNNIFRFGSDY